MTKSALLLLALISVTMAIHELEDDPDNLFRVYYSTHNGPFLTVGASAFDPDGEFLLYSSKINDTTHHLVVYYYTLRLHVPLPGMSHKDHITQIDYSPDGSVIYTGSQDGTVKIWANRNGFPLLRTLTAPGKVYHFIINKDQDRLVTVGDKRYGKSIIAVFNLNSGKRIDDGDMYHDENTFSADFSHEDEDMFATGSDDGTVGFWNVKTLRRIKKWDVREHYKDNYNEDQKNLQVKSVSFNPNGDGLAYGFSHLELNDHHNYGIIYKNGSIRHEGHAEGAITSLEWFPDGDRLSITVTFLFANFFLIVNPFEEILHYVFSAGHFLFGVDINHDGSMVAVEGLNKFSLLRIKYACEDIRYSTSDEDEFECDCKRGYEWSGHSLKCERD